VVYSYVDGLLEAIGANENVTLVIHDWGSALGFMWAMRHAAAVKGVAYMEAIVKPVSWADWPEGAVGIFKGFRSDKGEDLILNRNMFIEGVLPTSVIRTLSETEMDAYRAPHLGADDRQPLLNWPRQIPIEGEPEDIVDLVNEYGAFMAGSELPKLFINADPGSILVGPQREFCRSWPNQQEVTVKGLHFVQEDSPREIGQAVASWLETL
jgi:haloalkane dehalogenase